MNRNDRRIVMGAVIAAVMATAALMLTYIYAGQQLDGGTTADRRDTQRPRRTGKAKRNIYYAQPSRKTEEFPFDPNTADSTALLRLGLQPWQVQAVYRYRAMGGSYRSKEDFARLPGLTVKDYRRLEPYIRISADYLPASTLVSGAARSRRDGLHRDTVLHPYKIDTTQRVVLNTADTAELMRVPGIGSYYAREIVRYGQWLGGYVSVDQLDEIDDFPPAAKRYFVVSHPQPRKVNINKLSWKELRRHPYINYYQAKTIVEYRRLHGAIRSLQELALSRDFPPEAIARLEPYVEY